MALEPSRSDYRRDVVAFARNFLSVEPQPWQVELLRRLDRGERVFVAGRRPGRRRTLALLEARLTAMLERG